MNSSGNNSTNSFKPATGTQAFKPTSATNEPLQGIDTSGLDKSLESASKALKNFIDALKSASQQVGSTQGSTKPQQVFKDSAGDVAKVQAPAINPQEVYRQATTQPQVQAQPQVQPQEAFKQATVDKPQAPDNQFKPATAPTTAPVPAMQPVSEQENDIPSGWKQDKQGRWRDERGRFVPSDKLKEKGIAVPEASPQAMPRSNDQDAGMGLRAMYAMAKRSPVGYVASKVYGFASQQAGSTSINQALAGLPLGGLIAGSLGKLEELGMKGAQFELTALQAGMTRGLGQGKGYATGNKSYKSIKQLSNALGISPSASASMLKDIGMGTQGELSVNDIAGLVIQGFDPSSISSMGGRLQALGIGGAGTVLQTMNIAKETGLSNSGVTSFAQASVGFATGRRMQGLQVTDTSNVARRARSMMQGEQAPSLEANIATLGRFQSIGVNASKGLSGFTSGMTQQMLQAYAFEQAGGDVFKATALLENMSADPLEMRKAMQAQGASEEQIDLALLGTGQLTTTDIRRGKRAELGAEAERMSTKVEKTGASLIASRAVAQKGQRDLEQLYSSGGTGESVVSRFNTLMREQTKYQASVLKKMPTSAQITKIVEKLTAVLESTDFLKSIAFSLYGSERSKPVGGKTGVTLGNDERTNVRVRGGTRF